MRYMRLLCANNADAPIRRHDMLALGQTTHFVGREAEIADVQRAMLQARPSNFVLLHGIDSHRDRARGLAFR